MPTKGEKDALTGRETTGHEWDGVRELNTPLPRWWLYIFVATIIFAVGYSVLYPSVPWVSGHTRGVLAYTNRGAVADDITAAAARQKPILDRIGSSDLATIRRDPQLFAYAVAGGKAAFADNCVPCHRAGGAGAPSYPALASNRWLWGGSLDAIHQTISHGIRNEDPDSRQSQMPRFGLDNMLTAAQIGDVADYVRSLAGNAAPADAVQRGAKLFAENCTVCHGETGKGNREMGAPDLTAKISLYGGDRATIVDVITRARNGSMPSWSRRLDPVTIKMLAIYVHSLGGGE
jgi:cytochrome c oxidase cbb3-type subunit III